MRPAFLARMALAAALIVVVGCSDNKGKIEGTTWAWVDITAKSDDKSVAERRLNFDKDGHLFYTVFGRHYKGNYTLGMGPAVTFTLEEDLDGRKIYAHKLVVEGNQLMLTDADGKMLTFYKVN